MLYGQGYTIRGVQRILREAGMPHVAAIGRGEVQPAENGDSEEQAVDKAPAKIVRAEEPEEAEEQPQLSEENIDQLRQALTDLGVAKQILGAAHD